MKVCIAEKPSVAREIAEVLGATQRMNGYIKETDIQVTLDIRAFVYPEEPHESRELETLESGVTTYDPSPVRYQTNRESYV